MGDGQGKGVRVRGNTLSSCGTLTQPYLGEGRGRARGEGVKEGTWHSISPG